MQFGLQFLFSILGLLFGIHHTVTPLHQNTKTTPTTPTITMSPTPVHNNNQIAPPPLLPTVSSSQNGTKPLSDFMYPGASNVQNNSDSLTFQSTDAPTTIVSWYKNLFSQKNMHTTSIVQTSSNNNIIDKLAAANANVSVAISIQKTADQNVTTISVTNGNGSDINVHIDNKTY